MGTCNKGRVLVEKQFIYHILELAQSVVDFHIRFSIQHADDLENMKFRNQLLTEEVGEVARALNHSDYQQAIRESVDVAYIVLGTLLSHAPESFIHIMEVIKKNLDKDPSTYHLDTSGKIVRLEEDIE